MQHIMMAVPVHSLKNDPPVHANRPTPPNGSKSVRQKAPWRHILTHFNSTAHGWLLAYTCTCSLAPAWGTRSRRGAPQEAWGNTKQTRCVPGRHWPMPLDGWSQIPSITTA